MSFDDKNHSMGYFLGVLSSDESPYRGNLSFKGPSKDVSLVKEHPGEGASTERGGLGEGRGDLEGMNPKPRRWSMLFRGKIEQEHPEA